MPDFLQRYATPFVTGLFLVSLISGLALFFHVGPRAFHPMHEWLSVVLIAPFALHVWKNWRPMSIYLKRGAFWTATAISTIAAVAFFFTPTGPGAGRRGPPQMALTRALAAATPAQLAPALGVEAERIVAALKQRGFEAAATDMRVRDAAAKAGKDEGAVAAALVEAIGGRGGPGRAP